MSYDNSTKMAYPEGSPGTCARRVPTPNSGTPAFADKTRKPLADIYQGDPPMEALEMSVEEQVAATLCGNRKVEEKKGWTYREVFQMVEEDNFRHVPPFCKDEMRRKCEGAKTCIIAENGMNLKSAQDRNTTPEAYFAACRKVVLQNVRTVREEQKDED